MNRVLHIVPGTDDIANGMAVVARLLANEQGDAEVVDLDHGIRRMHGSGADEVWIHGMWLPKEWLACWRVLKAGKTLVRMTHGSLSPLYLKHQSPFIKWLVGPIERWCLRRCAKIVATCEAEKGWIERYLGPHCPPVEVTEIKRFFKLQGTGNRKQETGKPLHLLYLGRNHPLKGLEFLEEALRQISSVPHSPFPVPPQLKVVSNAFGEELEKVWQWCDILVLPTLSENFGLVVAEALERGKRVITTDGAPAWESECKIESVKCKVVEGEIWSGYGGRLIYLKGYRDGTPDKRVRLLKDAIEKLQM